MEHVRLDEDAVPFGPTGARPNPLWRMRKDDLNGTMGVCLVVSGHAFEPSPAHAHRNLTVPLRIRRSTPHLQDQTPERQFLSFTARNRSLLA